MGQEGLCLKPKIYIGEIPNYDCLMTVASALKTGTLKILILQE